MTRPTLAAGAAHQDNKNETVRLKHDESWTLRQAGWLSANCNVTLTTFRKRAFIPFLLSLISKKAVMQLKREGGGGGERCRCPSRKSPNGGKMDIISEQIDFSRNKVPSQIRGN